MRLSSNALTNHAVHVCALGTSHEQGTHDADAVVVVVDDADAVVVVVVKPGEEGGISACVRACCISRDTHTVVAPSQLEN